MTTLMEMAHDGLVTEEMRCVAAKEGVDVERVRKLLERGYIVIPRSANSSSEPTGIGKLMRTKINANIGTSRDYIDVGAEVEKAKTAQKYGADTIMDLSTGGDLDLIRRRIIDAVSVSVGSVPIYQAANRGIENMTSDDMFNAVRKHAEDGIDFVTIHAGVTRSSFERLKNSNRILDVVSRGGAFTISWMRHNDKENPFYSEYDYLLEIAREYELTLSLGDGMRPGCINDASDRAKFEEFIILGELVKRARTAGVQTLVEGPGHVPIDEIGLSVTAMKHLTDDAPVYLLGPLVTDIAPGYDHITAAIGGAVAGMYGADFLCMTTPSEHLALPDIEDIREGAVVTRIAAHAADLTKEGVRERARAADREMALARKNLDWNKQFGLAIDSERARAIHARSRNVETCSMCGELCSIKMMREVMGK
ncbi:hydroxymethylpyrimidine synthase [Candidatus Methanoperedens nitroreducens]|uniref:Phosphomethylpyrimidine synthase n=1 Tax=Candidatus Methanoperedens nitratireducens TaxID=1392998 RepID=A0A062V8A6_9EURY|nr:phosphomethylpyrimidine synthase ThiC [Candidatus Methanoperedens nitroreducens]KCZ73522.1 hydroxymethylpyrimidine synthase [Candidatus Methanoperedens nitroreducens]MDJ1422522.1 phosphomethylpyrimidine synthase ThiC [Candidatus Methanoperedens sp.]